MSFWKPALAESASAGVVTAADALKSGADWRIVGVAGLVGLMGGFMTALMAHQAVQHKAVQDAAAKLAAASAPVTPAAPEAAGA